MVKLVDLTGQQFSKLTVIKRAPNNPKSPKPKARWNCLCACGNQTIVDGANLKNGHTRSCGCLIIEGITGRFKTHGRRHSRIYTIWTTMKGRCLNPSNPKYSQYGGRGIEVCDRWKNSFENFAADMGEPPNGYSIDRINNNGNYEPSNCKWSNAKEQSNNTRWNHLVSFEGKTQNVSQWANQLGMRPATLFRRLRYWSIDDAFKRPVRYHPSQDH